MISYHLPGFSENLHGFPIVLGWSPESTSRFPLALFMDRDEPDSGAGL
jgi:hypothetical protein